MPATGTQQQGVIVKSGNSFGKTLWGLTASNTYSQIGGGGVTVVKAATTANITLSGTQTIDGYAAVLGDKILVKNQTNPAQNGVYTVAAAAWSGPTAATGVAVVNGTVSKDLFYYLSATNTYRAIVGVYG